MKWQKEEIIFASLAALIVINTGSSLLALILLFVPPAAAAPEGRVSSTWDICTLIEVVCPDETPPTLEQKIEYQARRAGVDPSAALLIAKCESGLNPEAIDPISGAKGLYQFTDSTWAYIKAPGHPFNVDENIRMFMLWYPFHPEWWTCE